MEMCDRHWDRLRELIEERGLGKFVAEDPERAAAQMKAEIEAGKVTAKSFDPLAGAMWAIFGNCLERVPESTAYLLQGPEEPEDAVEGYGPEYADRTWPRCPLCYLNLAHEASCTGCDLPKVDGYDFFLTKAADEQVTRAKDLFGESWMEAEGPEPA